MKASVRKILLFTAVLACVFCITVISLFSGIGGLHEWLSGADRHHVCNDEFCVVCSVMTLNEQIIRGLLMVFCLICFTLIIHNVTVFLRTSDNFRMEVQTPVCLKVKLSD